jgi:alanine racemase
MENRYYRDTWAEIDLSAIEENISNMKRHIGGSVELIAVVKANAYGHGDSQVAKTALSAGASMLAVAFLDEALALRKQGIKAPILVLGAVPPDTVNVCADNDITVTAYSNEWLKSAISYLEGTPLCFHMKIDSGMGRLGLKTENDVREMAQLANDHENLQMRGVFTHFATADETDTTYFQKQLSCFKNLVRTLPTESIMVHSSNSAAGLRYKEQWFNAVRFGISMYGLSPSEEMKSLLPFPLRQAFSLHAKLVHVKKITKGESVSYGAAYTAEKDEWIGTVPIGYADGWLRRLSGSEVLINGKRQKTAGRICMDQMMVTLPEELPVGTKVTLIGTQGSETISMDEIANRLETINYEIPCTISSRVPRMFLKNGSIMEIRNSLLPNDGM